MKQLVITIALGMATTAAVAGEAKMSFSEADANSDGAITRAEAASFAALEQRFDAVDENSNGLIERQEYSQAEASEALAEKAGK